jgi:pyruvate dehydrogenase E1 component
MVPFYIYYSMFGFQRIGDLAWAAGDIQARGFLIGGTAGRTTLEGEGLQHEDGHSHVLFSVLPNVLCYDPAWAYEVATILRDGLERMYVKNEDVFYYLTLYNQDYPMPAMPEGVKDGILRGLYRYKPAPAKGGHRAQILAGGVAMLEALRAQELLASRFGVAAEVWSATSFQQLRVDALTCERWNRLHPGETARVPYVTRVLGGAAGPIIAVSDYIKAWPDSIARWAPRRFVPLGTDGFGRSDTREALRRHFEVDAEHIAAATLSALVAEGAVSASVAARAIKDLGIDPNAMDPREA